MTTIPFGLVSKFVAVSDQEERVKQLRNRVLPGIRGRLGFCLCEFAGAVVL